MPAQSAQNPAVCYDHDGFSQMLLSQLLKTRNVSLYLLPQALPMRKNVIRVPGPIELVLLRMTLSNVFASERLKDAEVPLSQPCIKCDLMSGRRRNDLSGLVSSTEVAAIKGLEALMGETPGESMGLAQVHGGQRAVEMSLPSFLDVPNCFAVSNHDHKSPLHDDSVPICFKAA